MRSPSPARRIAPALFPLIFFLAGRATQAQQPELRVDVTLVRVPFVAEDAAGRLIRDLRREELTLIDNGVPQPIQDLWTELDRPLSVALIMDVSTSEMGFVRSNREAVRQFIGQVVGPYDEVLVATVDEQPRLITGLTSSLDEAIRATQLPASERHAGAVIGEPCQPPKRLARRGTRGCVGTAIWDGVFHVVRSNLAGGQGRKALVLLSDGLDLNSSVHSLSSAIEAAQAAGVAVYTLRYLSGPYLALSPFVLAQAAREHGMEQIAVETGGLAFKAPRQLQKVYAQIEEDLRSQYILAYSLRSEGSSGKWHRLEVRATRPGIRIRAQAGYREP